MPCCRSGAARRGALAGTVLVGALLAAATLPAWAFPRQEWTAAAPRAVSDGATGVLTQPTEIPCADPYEPNEGISAATPITVTMDGHYWRQYVWGTICPNSDLDYYRLAVCYYGQCPVRPDSGTVTLSAGRDVEMAVYDRDGRLLGRAVELVSVPLPGEAPFYVAVSALPGASDSRHPYALAIVAQVGTPTARPPTETATPTEPATATETPSAGPSKATPAYLPLAFAPLR